MRRALSVILLILGGWLLASEVLMAWINVGQPPATELGIIGIMLAFSAPFLLLGMWASPGNRFADLGVTMISAAGVGAAVAAITFIMLSDPGFTNLLPSDRPVPYFRVATVSGVLNLLIIGGGGWLLYRFGRRWPMTEARR
ncbi:MAG: hypothetical protein ACJ8FS_07550 [Sphingomicrobium sp.]